jgi:L-asparaginase
MLKSVRSKLNAKITEVMLTDSTRMTNNGRKAILRHCKKCKEDKIVIVHGTDSMVRTADLLAKSVKDKTIVLTGALVPYLYARSDALFNLGNALAFAQTLPHGVYISMNGRCFNWDNARKNKETGEFEEVAS